jgi:CDP-diacylglycerol--glycerol-3-phosphate 3-phosphatidyltransferase
MANLITISRFPLLFFYVVLLYFGNTTALLWCIPLIAFIFFMDTVDGYVARMRGEVSLLGSAFDIATDRTLEIVLWVVFSDLRLIPIIIPIIAIVRGTTVDAVRAVGMSKGLPAFEQVQHPLSRMLVSSRFMRHLYGIVKGIAFILLTVNLWARTSNSAFTLPIHTITLIVAWLAIAMTIARGLPVLVEGYDLFRARPQ